MVYYTWKILGVLHFRESYYTFAPYIEVGVVGI